MKYRIDPELQYCPQCQDEYRAGIERCAACEVELISGTMILAAREEKENRLAGRKFEVTREDELTDVIKGNILTIKQLQAKLKKEGFPSLIAGDGDSCGKGCCGGGEVRLQVRVSDLQDVMGFMAREHARTTGLADHVTTHGDAVFDATAMNTTCPACGCNFSPQSQKCPDCGLCF